MANIADLQRIGDRRSTQTYRNLRSTEEISLNPGQNAMTTANSRTSAYRSLHLPFAREFANAAPHRRFRLLTGQIDWTLIGALLLALTVLVGSWHIILGALVP